jgi:hypothetical protein
MCLPIIRSIAICIAAAGVLAYSPGCKSSPDAKATVGSMSAFGVEVAKIKDSIDGTLAALEGVAATKPADIQANYETYSKSVQALDKQAAVVRRRADEMKAMGNDFFKDWETPDSMSSERRAQLTAAYGRIQENMLVARDDFKPFLASLKDIEGYLKLDRSLQGVQSTAELVKKAKDDGARTKSHIDAVLTQLNSVRGMLSTKS